NNNRSAQIAIAEAIARHGSDQPLFVEPLLAMLSGTEASVREPASKALAAFKNNGVAEKLIAVAADKTKDRAVRLAAIGAMDRILDKKVVNTLIGLLEDNDGSIRTAAVEALSRLTNIRAFGDDRQQWQQWWLQNKNKDRSEWLADLADSLGKSKANLEAENARLRTRLAKSLIDLYTATPAAQRDAMLLSYMKDPMQDVRLVGLELLNRANDGGSVISQDVRSQVRSMLTDTDDRIRAESAKLLAGLAEADALNLLLERLKVENVTSVRRGLLMALGQLHDTKSLPVVLAEVSSKDDEIAAAAAIAVSKIAAKQALDESARKDTVAALEGRFRRTEAAIGADAALREALLAAMGDIGDKSVTPMLEGALKDDAATVRLAAVASLAKMGEPSSCAVIEKLVTDTDRGVRGAATTALGNLGGKKYLQTILQRTDPATEDDAANRQQAWNLAMGILAKADAKVLSQVADKLATRPDATAQRIKILQMYVALLRDAKSLELPDALRQLGAVLVKNSRQAEAAPCLAESFALLTATKQSQAGDVWLEWIDALLGADNQTAVKTISEQTNDALFAKAMQSFDARLSDLETKGNWSTIILLTGEANKQLNARLSETKRKEYQDLLAKAKTQQDQADRQRVTKLVSQLTVADEAGRKAAATELQTMGDRAVNQLLLELKAAVDTEKPNPTAEQAIADMLRQLAPKLTGYDPAATKDQKLKLINSWIGK
ncbi:MAG: hypothetical protein EHM48_06645, partial [Planctomycetaceae bacterium]